MSDTSAISANSKMSEIMAAFPGARRALFRNYHIGGCSSCAFKENETIQELCLRNDELDVEEVLQKIIQAHEEDKKLLLEPNELAELRDNSADLKLVDIRSREEHEAVSIQGDEFLTQELMQNLINEGDKGASKIIVFYDHMGRHSLDVASYLIGHGVKNVKCLRGGIDAWAENIDEDMPQYELEK